MGTISKRNLIFLLFSISMVTLLGDIYGLAQEGEVLHLRHRDVLSFIEKHPEYIEISKDLKLDSWQCDFFCWDYRTRRILIPNRSDIPERLHEGLSRALRNQYNEVHDQEEITKLITKDEMLFITLRYLSDKLDHFVDRIKKKCNHDEGEIKFYLFEFYKSEITGSKKMKVRYCLEKSQENPCLLPAVVETKESCINEWENIFKGEEQLIIPDIKFEIIFLKCDWNRIDNENLQYKIEFCDNRDKQKPYHQLPEELYYKYTDIRSKTYKLKFNIGDEFLKKIRTKGIWIVNNNENTRITSTSLYSMLKLSRASTLIENKKDKIFQLYFAKTRNFPEDHSNINPEIDNDMKNILSFIRGIINNEKRKIEIHLIGYADRTGKPAGNNKDWLRKNNDLALKRAEKVKTWLEVELKEFTTWIEKIDTEVCDKKFFEHTDRFVEVRILLRSFYMQ